MVLSEVCRIITALFCILLGAVGGWSVSYTPESVCALEGSSVELHSYYSYPDGLTITKTFWFTRWLADREPDDLMEDDQYRGRVNYTSSSNNTHTLTIKPLMLQDANNYRFRILANDEKSAGKGLPLSVTGLKVLVNSNTLNWGDTVKLTCNTTCSLSTNLTYIWYQNSQPVTNKHTTTGNNLTIQSFKYEYSGLYSCAVRGHEDLPSPAVCVWKCYGVAYNPESVCALEGSSVELHSYYSYPDGFIIVETLWFIRWPKHGEPDDLIEDMHYHGRVNYTGNTNNNTLRIHNLTLNDTNEYRFRFTANDTEGKFAGGKVHLSVSGLQVLLDPVKVNEGSRVTLTCSTTCSLSNNPTYIWYKNSQPVNNKHTANGNTLTIQSIRGQDSGRYSCAVRGHEDLPSPAVCVWECYGVAYNPESVCALEGSSVELHSYYSYADDLTVRKTFWFIRWPQGQEPDDLIEDVNYQGRVSYTGNDNIHTLRITNLRLSDASDYRFRFLTSEANRKYAGVNVPLLLTGLQVLVDPQTLNEGSRVTLTCNTTCSLSNNPTYIWYKNSQPVTNKYTANGNTLIMNSATPEDSGHYSCAVKGSRSSPARALTIRYSPRNTLASVHPSGPTMEGSSVTLTCSSDANPRVDTYSWYKKCGNQPSLVGYGQSHSLPNISSEESGQYHCVAENDLGRSTSPVVKVNVTAANHQADWILPAAVIGGTLAGFVVGALVGALAHIRMAKTRKDRKSPTADPRVKAENSTDDIYMDPDFPTSDDYANLDISDQGVKYNCGENPTAPEDYANFC